MLFSALPFAMQEDLRAASPVMEFERGRQIQFRGDDADGFWLIEEGSVTVGQFLPSGEFRAAARLGKGDSWGELAMFARHPRVVDALAQTPCKLRYILARRFDEALNNYPGAERGLLAALSRQFQETIDLMSGIRRGTALSRIAGIVSTLARNAGQTRIRISQQELGELVGLTRATVNATLRDLSVSGCIARHYGEIEVVDAEMLNAAALE